MIDETSFASDVADELGLTQSAYAEDVTGKVNLSSTAYAEDVADAINEQPIVDPDLEGVVVKFLHLSDPHGYDTSCQISPLR